MISFVGFNVCIVSPVAHCAVYVSMCAFSGQAEDYFSKDVDRRQSAFTAGHQLTKLTYVVMLSLYRRSTNGSHSAAVGSTKAV